jgi:hypothetical protein
MKKQILISAVILFPVSGLMAQVQIPKLTDSPAGLEIKKSPDLKSELSHPAELTDFNWYSFPSPTIEPVTQASIACDGSEMMVFYRKPRPSLNTDEGIVEKWTGNSWANVAHATNECHEPDIDINGSVVVTTWNDDGNDYGYGTNINGPWVSMTGTLLYKQWYPRAAMAMGLPYMSFTCKYSDGQPFNYDMLHIRSLIGAGDRIELNGGWSVTYSSVGMRTDITGDENAWYCVFSQQQFLYVKKGAIVDGVKEHSELGEGFRMYNPVSRPEIVIYKGTPVVAWFENGNTELYVAEWEDTQWMLLGSASVPTGLFYSLRMAASSSYLYLASASTESDTSISVNLYDGEQWYGMPPVQDHVGSEIGTVDIAVHNDEPVVAFTENNQLTVKKFTSSSITNTDQIFTNPLSIMCYPNPTHDMITVQPKESGNYSIEIATLTGQIIHHKVFTGKSLRVDLSSYQKGVYFLTVKEKDFKATQRIVKL